MTAHFITMGSGNAMEAFLSFLTDTGMTHAAQTRKSLLTSSRQAFNVSND